MKLKWRFNGGHRIDRNRITEAKRLRRSISTPLRFGVEVEAWPVILILSGAVNGKVIYGYIEQYVVVTL